MDHEKFRAFVTAFSSVAACANQTHKNRFYRWNKRRYCRLSEGFSTITTLEEALIDSPLVVSASTFRFNAVALRKSSRMTRAEHSWLLQDQIDLLLVLNSVVGTPCLCARRLHTMEYDKNSGQTCP